MATSREENEGGGLGTGGKFRKKPFRRTQTTPYDRPPTALRNASSSGWLSKLVDPAQRLITSGAHRFFSTVFRKRLPAPPPPHPQAQEASEDTRNKNQEAIRTDFPGVQEASDVGGSPSNKSCENVTTDLEQILKQKTFTRSEIDRLTALLHSRTVDIPREDEEKRSDLILSTPGVPERKEIFQKTPAQGAIVLDEDVASPAEIAKAYMVSRPSKVSPTMLGVRSQTFMEDSAVQSNHSFPSKSAILSIVPRSSGHSCVPENGFMTPRSRGRSAIYNMARTPYFKVHATPATKNIGSRLDANGGPSSSSSQLAFVQGKLSGSNQGALKRRSSVLDNDIGSVGPLRRTRQKSSVLYSKGLSLPVSGGPFSNLGKGVRFEAAQYVQSPNVQPLSSSLKKPLLLGEHKHKFSAEKGDNTLPSTSTSSVPSKSSEMASKILEQLDKLTPSKEKPSELKLLRVGKNSPTKLSPSMLHGRALKSLEDVDSSKYIENVEDNRLNGSHGVSLPDAQEFTSQKQDKVEEMSLLKFVPPDRSTSVVNNSGSAAPSKDTRSVGISISAVSNSVSLAPQKKRGFHMSAHEDDLDLDECFTTVVAPDPVAEGREKSDATGVDRKTIATDPIPPEEPQASFEVKPVSVILEKEISSTLPVTSSTNMIGQTTALKSIFENNASPNESKVDAPIFSFGDKLTPHKEPVSSAPVFKFGGKDAPFNEQNAVSPIFKFGDKVASAGETNAVSPMFSFGKKVASPVKLNAAGENGYKGPEPLFKFGESAGAELGASSGSKSESGTSFSLSAAPATGSLVKESVSDKDGKNNNLNTAVSFSTLSNAPSPSVSTATSAASIFSFGLSATATATATATASNLNNGSFASSPSLFSSSPTAPVISYNNVTSHSSSSNTTTSINTTFPTITSSSLSTSAPSATIFKFSYSTNPSTLASPMPSTRGTDSVQVKTKPDSTTGSLSSTLFSGTSSVSVSNGGGDFGLNAAATSSSVNSQSQGSAFFSGSGPVFSAQASVPAGSEVATSTQSMPLQFGLSSSSSSPSPSPSPSFGLTPNTGFSSGTSLFGSSTSTPNLFNSSAGFGLVSSSSSEANPISSSSGTTSSLFGSSWQPAKSPVFGSSFSSTTPSTGLSFGSTAFAPTNGSGSLFGTSTNASSSIFSFTSSTAAAPSQPGFGNPNSAFVFGSASSGNNTNDQMSMEDSMAEDTLQPLAPSVPVFSQQPLSPPPSSGYIFGSTAPSVANHFQFQSQQNLPAPQNSSPFQASGSLDFNAGAGGSFSLGAGGVDKANRKFVKVKHKSRKK